jgi:predicted RNA-binding protein with PIN domain
MPLRYVIDAYNIINHTSFKSIHKKIRDPQRDLLWFVKNKRLGKKCTNKVVIVFDGYPKVGDEDLREPNIDIIFSREETADTRIKMMVESSKSPRDIVVVSDDREIQFFIKSVGARSIGVEEFVNQGAGSRQHKKEEDLNKPELNYSQMSKINQELKGLWLK